MQVLLLKQRLFFLWMGLTLAAPAMAGQCLEDWACWEVRESDDRVEFWVKNMKE